MPTISGGLVSSDYAFNRLAPTGKIPYVTRPSGLRLSGLSKSVKKAANKNGIHFVDKRTAISPNVDPNLGPAISIEDCTRIIRNINQKQKTKKKPLKWVPYSVGLRLAALADTLDQQDRAARAKIPSRSIQSLTDHLESLYASRTHMNNPDDGNDD
ncbi:hypothetical protein HDV00_007188, partial [Rhizophlyctis rosea]